MDDFFESNLMESFYEANMDQEHLDTSYFQIDDEYIQNEFFLSNYQKLQVNEKNLQETCSSRSPENRQCIQQKIEEQQQKQTLYHYEKREKNEIQVSRQTKNKYVSAKTGNKRQTSQLTINYKNLLLNIIKKQSKLNIFNGQQQQIISQFRKSSYNLKNFRQFFGVTDQSQMGKSFRIQKNCIKNLSKTQTLQRIFLNKKINFQNKLICLKFIEEFRERIVCPQKFTRWKQDYN